MTHLHKNIAFLRKQQKLEEAAFIRLCNLETKLALIEDGRRNPTPEELLRIAEVLRFPLNRLILEDVSRSAKKIQKFKPKMLALDIDGVLTDGGMYYTQQGDEFKKFNAKDGLAIKTLTAAGFPVAFVSSGINDHIIKERAKLLGVRYVYVGTWKKLEILEKWCAELKIDLKNVAYIGDDINDLPVIEKVGFSACPSDAVEKVRINVDVILYRKGGDACVREFVEDFIGPVTI
jgi:3-deoxy-D-manno-octulosonate 8-phosphate phosphatase (KDO 8-P phosphatase)